MQVIKGNTTKINLDTGLDLTGYTLFEIGYKDPDGITGVWSAADEGAGIISVEQSFNIEGDWVIWSQVDGSIGESIILKVYDVPEEDEQITTLDFVKSYLGITSGEYDFKILALIPVVERDIETISNKPLKYVVDYFGTTPIYATEYDPADRIVAVEMIAYKIFGRTPEDGYKDIESESLGSYSISYGTNTMGYPKSITSSIRKYVRFGNNI